jgi:hypothetical protein
MTIHPTDWSVARHSIATDGLTLLLLLFLVLLLLVLQNARNVLVCSSRSAPYGMVAKLADLGLSRVIKQHSTHRTTNTVSSSSCSSSSSSMHSRLMLVRTSCCRQAAVSSDMHCTIAFLFMHRYGQSTITE